MVGGVGCVGVPLVTSGGLEVNLLNSVWILTVCFLRESACGVIRSAAFDLISFVEDVCCLVILILRWLEFYFVGLNSVSLALILCVGSLVIWYGRVC